jgi:hypothetical protein
MAAAIKGFLIFHEASSLRSNARQSSRGGWLHVLRRRSGLFCLRGFHRAASPFTCAIRPDYSGGLGMREYVGTPSEPCPSDVALRLAEVKGEAGKGATGEDNANPRRRTWSQTQSYVGGAASKQRICLIPSTPSKGSFATSRIY